MPRTSYILIIAISIGHTQCMYQHHDNTTSKIPIGLLQEGDIAFRRGVGFTSEIVAYNDADGKYSHAGIVVKKDSCFVVVHAVPGENPDGRDIVMSTDICDFFATDKAIKGEIMRLELDSLQRQSISHQAMEKVRLQVPFDHGYNLNDTSKLYCTELLQLLYRNIGIDLAQGRITKINAPGFTGNYIFPSDIHKNTTLKSIFFFEINSFYQSFKFSFHYEKDFNDFSMRDVFHLNYIL